MKLIVNGQDYCSWLDAHNTLNIERKLNEPSVCTFSLSLPDDGSVAIPLRFQKIAVSGDEGTLYFTGYIATDPIPEYAGMDVAGARFRIAVYALSDEAALDQLAIPQSRGGAGMTAGSLMTNLVTNSGSTALLADGLALNATMNQPSTTAGESWSKAAGQIANEARSTYRALGGALTLAEIPAAIHALSDSDGTLDLSCLVLRQKAPRMPANDVTVCGQHEATTYVQEFFSGDGTTTQFELGAMPYMGSSSKAQLIHEQFDESAIDGRIWCAAGGAGYFSLGAGGLVMNGGSGVDGATMLSWLNMVEMGGTLVLESGGIKLSAGSSGVTTSFYAGLDTQSGCIAGFQVIAAPGSGATSVQPVISGLPAGLTYAIDPTSLYVLRVRVHCKEMERQLSVYRSYGDAGSIVYGGQSIAGSAQIRMEIQESVNGVAGVPVTLYDGSIASLPSACSVVAASSVNLIGTMRSIALTQAGSGWVVSTPAGCGPYSRRMGTLAEGGECHLERTGKLVFETGCAPLAGERLAVSYRAIGRAVGRAVNAASQQQCAGSNLHNVASWVGSVTSPTARSSADCRNAAMALVQAASSTNALWSGNYQGTHWRFQADIWPGDALSLNLKSINLNTQMVIRSVKLTYKGSYPELVSYAISFANEWAEDLAIRTSKTVFEDAWLPAPIAPTVLPNLTATAVTSLTDETVSINTGVAAPAGGGFEIRRRDFGFMPGEDADLVMRGTQQNLTFSRQSANDRFYIRMFDGSTPPNYSEFSAALFINLPLGS